MERTLGLTKTDLLGVFTYFFLPILVFPILFYLLWKSIAGRIEERKNLRAVDNPPIDSN